VKARRNARTLGGRGTAEVIEQSEFSLADPTWTPDGKSIIFGEPSSEASGGIYRMELNTRKVSQVPNSDGLYSPRVSPDGRYISALTVNQAKLMLFDTGRRRWSNLAEGVKLGYNEWSHDGKYVYLRENQAGASKLVRVRIGDRVSEDVLSLKDFPQLSDILSLWIGPTPDDALLLMRDRSVQEIYALELQFQ
jgi:Tol biopolymer transport system component